LSIITKTIIKDTIIRYHSEEDQTRKLDRSWIGVETQDSEIETKRLNAEIPQSQKSETEQNRNKNINKTSLKQIQNKTKTKQKFYYLI
jgi:hypothetical protein